MKHLYYLILFGVGWLYSGQVSAQDLIERTRDNVSIDVSRHAPSVAFLESQSLKHVGPYQVTDPFNIAPDVRRSSVAEYIDGQVMLDLPVGTLPRLMKGLSDGIDLRIPVAPGKEIALDLVEVFPINSEFVGHLSDGTTFTLQDYHARFYRGAIKGVPNSFASVTIADGMFRGLIGDEYGNYVLAELNGSETEFVLYNDRKLKMDRPPSCGVEDEIPYPDKDQEMLTLSDRISNEKRSDDCIDVMVEMEEDFYDDWGNVSSAVNFIYALMNEVATIYNNENISITLKDIILWTTTDPYTNTSLCSATNDLLDEFADERRNNYNGRLAHLITSRNVGGGCAFVDVLCSSYTNSSSSSPHAVSSGLSTSVTAFPTYSWNVMVFTHEMGHNIGSKHTHACVWNGNNTAIDGCGPAGGFPTEGTCSTPPLPTVGTIMSYCHLIGSVGISLSAGFGTQPGNKIRSEVYNSSCTLDCGSSSQCPRYIYLDGNVGSDTYYANNKIEMGGTVLNGRNVQLRSEGLIELNPGFRVNAGGYWLAGYSTCAAALAAQNDHAPTLDERESPALQETQINK